jgi:bifunctional non-homologous end joining protein LigD
MSGEQARRRPYSHRRDRRYISFMARAKAKKKTAAARAVKRKRLPEYEAKRDFAVTPEPAPGAVEPSTVPTYMIHKHHASRLHYDLRLEMDDALASWAVPKGPSYDPDVKRLAVQTEDHPLEYGSFEGRIPDGEYGAGDSLIWDRGVYETVPPGQASQQRKKGHLHLVFSGEKLQGAWHLVRTRGPAGTKSNWILFKARDAQADKDRDIVADAPGSVVSGRAATRGPESRSRKLVHMSPEALLKRVFPPMLATLVSEPPEPDSDWLLEVKYDGYRALTALSGGRVAMVTRNGLDLTTRFPHIARAWSRVVVGDAVIDGEICALDAHGRPRFQLLQEGDPETILFAFDLLWLNGEDLRGRPLDERRDLLLSVMSNLGGPLRVAERVEGPAKEALARVAAEGLEGLIAKRRGSTYVSTRSKDWLKLKAQKTQEVAIIGFTPSTASDALIGALLIGVVKDGALTFAGKVGTGFSTKLRAELKKELGKDKVAVSPVKGVPRLRDATWVEPRLVGQVQFTEWTADGKLRHPSFLGLREDKSPMETTMEKPAEPPKKKAKTKAKTEAKTKTKHAAKKAEPARADADRARVTLTNPDKVLYPKDGYTKRDLADYYAAVAAPLLRALAGRPLALQHWPNGIAKSSFFRQGLSDSDREPWMTLVDTPARTKSTSVHHLVADKPEALQWLAQRATLTLHMWASRAGSLEQPDWVIFDLDPAEGRGVEQAIPVAHALHRLFDELSMPSLVKTTGKRGLHVLVPLLPGHTHDDAVEFALKIGGAVTSVLKEATLERAIAKRNGRLYLDCLQNGYGKTIVAPYSPRAVDGAPVSAPLKWSEVNESLDVAAFTIATMPKRLAQLGDLFAPALDAGVRLPRLR